MKKRLLVGVAACLAVQVGYAALLRRGFRRMARTPAPPAARVPLSVVVAARDEAGRLPRLAAALDRQTHPPFEIIVVDDHSSDATAVLVRAWAARNRRVQYVAHGGPAGKKAALTRGIAAARTAHLALTDADCAPPPGWLAALAAWHGLPGETIVACYAPLEKAPGALNALARYETFVTAFLMAAAAGWHRPYMATGRGLSYSKALFEKAGGFDAGGFGAHGPLVGGDDDLFVQRAARLPGVRAVVPLDPQTFVPSPAPLSWRAWLRQKRRHLSDGPHYSLHAQAHLALFHASALALWLAPVAGLPGAALLAARMGAWAWALAPAAAAFQARDLWRRLPLLEPLYGLYNALLPLATFAAGRPARW